MVPPSAAFTRNSAPSASRVATFADRLKSFGDAPALVGAVETITYAELHDRVAERALQLSDRRLMLLKIRNDISSVVDYLAALVAENPVLITCADNDKSVQRLIDQYDPDVIADRGHLYVHRHTERPGLHPELAVLISTSGTTGSSKLVRLSYANLDSNAKAIAAALQIRSTDRAITSLPLSYCYGLSVLNSHLSVGASLVLSHESVTSPTFWDLLQAERVTTFAGVPHTFDMLDKVGFARMQLPQLRYITQAGGRMPAEQVKRYAELGQERGFDLVVMYGQTEATARMSVLPPDQAALHPESIGQAIPGGSFSLVDEGGNDQANAGELVYHGPNVMLGYADSPSDLAAGRTVERLHTGDIARVTSDGSYEIIGRKNRVAKLFGLRIDLDMVESTLRSAGIVACCYGNDERLLVASESEVDPERLVQVTATACGVPTSRVVTRAVERLPRTASGKLDYPAIRELFDLPSATTRQAGRFSFPWTHSRTTRTVLQTYAHLLSRPDATLNDSFVSLGGDSLSYVEVSIHLEALLGELPTDWASSSISDLEGRRRSRGGHFSNIETSVALRAAAIVCVVGTHVGLFTMLGGAHVLLAVAGFVFARFALAQTTRSARLKHIGKALAFIAVPSVVIALFVKLFTDQYAWTTPLLMNWTSGIDHWTVDRQFWFIEVLLGCLIVSAVMLAIPRLDKLERSDAFGFALVLVLVAEGWQLALTFLDQVPPNQFGTLHFVFWFFALGWLIERSQTLGQRVVATGLALIGVVGFFDNPYREAFVLVGLLLLVWTAQVPIPRLLARPVSLLAAGSLYIYLIHWQVYPVLDQAPPVIALTACLTAGVACWLVISGTVRRIESGRRAKRIPAGSRAEPQPEAAPA